MQCCFKCRRGSWPLLIFAICLSIAAPASSYLLLIFPLQMSWVQQSLDCTGVVLVGVVVLVFLAFYLLLISSLMSIDVAVLTLVVAMPLRLSSPHLFKCFHFFGFLSPPALLSAPILWSWCLARTSLLEVVAEWEKTCNWQHFFYWYKPMKTTWFHTRVHVIIFTGFVANL